MVNMLDYYDPQTGIFLTYNEDDMNEEINKKRNISIPSIIVEDEEKSHKSSSKQSSIEGEEELPENNGYRLKASESRGSISASFSEAKRWTTRASQMIVHVPVEHLKKIAQTESIGSLSRETEHFVGITTVHGPLRVYRGKGIYRWLWAGALLLCVILFLYQFVLVIQQYVSKPTVSQVSYLMPDDGLQFPAITICSYNPIRNSYVLAMNQTGAFSTILLDYLMLSFFEVQFVLSINNASGLAAGEADLQNYKRNVDPNFKINEFFMEAGFACSDLLKKCSFGGREFDCCSYARPILTDMGKCFRLELSHSSEIWLRKQIQAGVNNGLQIIADFQADEQIQSLKTRVSDVNSQDPMFINEFENGFRYYIHSDEMVPYLSTESISVSPGSRIYSAISPTRFTLLSTEAWGNCSNTWPKDIPKTTTYSASKCKSLCRARFFSKSCGCSPLVYNLDGEYPVCTASELYKCLRDKLLVGASDKDSAQSILQSCPECLIECDRWLYYTYNSYSFGYSQAALNWFQRQNPRWTAKYIKQNFITMNIFYRDLSYTEYQQVQSTNLVTTLSNIGGNMGMFIGMSLLSVIEVIIYVYKSSWIFISKKRRQYMVEKKAKEKEREKYLEETIEAAQRKAEHPDSDDEGTFAGRTFNRVRKFATAIRDRSMSVVWPNYQDQPPIRQNFDVEANKGTRSNTTTSNAKSEKSVTFESPKRKKTSVFDGPLNRKKTVVDNILHNRLFGSGAAKVDLDEQPTDEILLEQGCIANGSVTLAPHSNLDRRRSRSFEHQRDFAPVFKVVNEDYPIQRSYSISGVESKPPVTLGLYNKQNDTPDKEQNMPNYEPDS